MSGLYGGEGTHSFYLSNAFWFYYLDHCHLVHCLLPFQFLFHFLETWADFEFLDPLTRLILSHFAM